MVGLKNVQTLIGLITLFLAYIFTITPVGYFRAWVAKKMGDTTGEDLGFLTLNPWVHIDLFGLVWLLGFSQPKNFSGFGWGKHIPVNPHNIHATATTPRWVRLGCAFFSDSVAHIVLATCAVISFTIIFGPKTLTFAGADTSTYSLVVLHILIAFVGLNISLSLVQLVINAMVLLAMRLAEGNSRFNDYIYYFILLAPLIILLLAGDYLHHILLYGIVSIESCIVTLLHGT